MPASEETYRRQPTLHLVFAISSIAMLLSTVWMVMADHLRPWKQVQRQFQYVEREKLEAAEKQKLEEQKAKYQKQIDEIDAKIEAADDRRRDAGRDLRTIDNELKVLEGKTENDRHPAAVPEGRSRQQAQPLRRHDRPGRGTRGAGVPEYASSPGRARARGPFARARKGQGGTTPRRRPRRKSCWASSTTSRKRRNG